MSEPLHDRAGEIFLAACNLAGEELAAFLDRECGGDEMLRDEVDRLLAHDKAPHAILESGKTVRGGKGVWRKSLGNIPSQIGVYRIDREIGRGGMGVVYLATDTVLDRRVAIKSLSPEFASDAKRLARLTREAKLLASVSHPNIAIIHHIESSGTGQYHLILEYIEGVNLGERLALGTIPLLDALQWARQIAQALEAAHERGVIHRDLKPSNVMISRERQVKVLDFGLAKSVAAAEPSEPPDTATTVHRHTREGDVMGTAGYMSPEQARGEAVDRRTDIWSFGALLFEMLSGGRAFPGRVVEAISATLRHEPDFRSLPRQLPAVLVDMLRRCLRKSPEARLQDIGDARVVLDEAIEALSGHDETTRLTIPPVDNLPPDLTSFIGRERELAEIERLLSTARLLTLTGAGGCGKTRLAIEAGRRLLGEFPDGVWFAELGGLRDPALIPQTIAQAVEPGDRAAGTAQQQLIEALRERRALIIIDNCEHLLDGCAQVIEDLLRRCARMRIIATSCEALRIAGEQAFRVPSLTLPGADEGNDVEAIAAYESVRLFMDRSQLMRPEFELASDNAADVACICHRLDGIPLAIELAAARVRSLTLPQIIERLDDRLHFLRENGRGRVSRHQTLCAAADWSYELLSTKEQALFRRLSVFRGGFGLEAIERICAMEPIDDEDMIELLTALVDKSLVSFELRAGGEGHYRVPEILREYAAVKLDEMGETQACRAAHLAHYRALGEKAEPHLAGGRDQAIWLKILAAEHDNIRAALGFRLADARLQRAALAIDETKYDEAFALLQECLPRFEESGDRHRVAFTYHNLADVAHLQGRPNEAKDAAMRALTIGRELGDELGVAVTLNLLGRIARSEMRQVDAVKLCAGAQRLHDHSRTALTDEQQRHVDEIVDAATRVLGADGVASARESASHWTVEQLMDPSLALPLPG